MKIQKEVVLKIPAEVEIGLDDVLNFIGSANGHAAVHKLTILKEALEFLDPECLQELKRTCGEKGGKLVDLIVEIRPKFLQIYPECAP